MYSQLELERGIHFYRSLLSQYFPFVILSDTCLDSRKFAKQRPFLSLVLAMLGCIQDRARQRALAVACRKYLAVHILQEGEKSLDLLQGLLLKIHWYQIQFELPNQRNTFLHLAMAMVVDLELNKSPLARNRLKNLVAATGVAIDEPPVALKDHDLDQKRAFLGCLYLSSVISKCATHMDGVRFSEHAERCLDHLEASQTASDQDAVLMLRLQQTVETFETARSLYPQAHRAKSLAFDVESSAFGQTSQTNVMEFLHRWEDELSSYWARVPGNDKTDLLRVQYEYARICLYEISIEESLFETPLDRFEILQKCLTAIKALHTVFMPVTQQPAILLNVPSHLFAQSSHSAFVAIQLCSVQCTDWSYKVVERELNLTYIFGQSVRNMDGMVAAYPPEQIPEFFLRLQPIGRSVQKWYATKLLAWEEGDTAMEAPNEYTTTEHDVDLNFLGQFLDLDDNMWLQKLLSPGESWEDDFAI
ncbi:hypothetical protein K504DRAFT_456993 [Pleomassaria siparia CBS 279.74]|uniref:Transcription factor domain-containing protein n=1 Tax=Pleomassaria siparia CBS 279.74 TaxID=1314801 RepID=A0A6G1KQG4_9PLEO|nr:hypothetical protein K504DRAFT_456993 [Pleomassaria siparia CBS 279.74]